MKKFLTLAILSSLSTLALADIPRPPQVGVSSFTIEGEAAAEFSKALNGEKMRGSSLRTQYSSYNVFQSSDRKLLVVCETTVHTMGGRQEDTSCTVTKSQRPLPKFVPVIRMG